MLKNGQKLSKIAKNIPKKATYIHLWPVFLPPWVHFASNHLSPWSEMNISGHWGRRYFSLTPAPTVSCHFFLVSLRLLLRRPRGSGPSATRQATPAHCATRSFGGTLSRCFGHESRPGLPPPPLPPGPQTGGGPSARRSQRLVEELPADLLDGHLFERALSPADDGRGIRMANLRKTFPNFFRAPHVATRGGPLCRRRLLLFFPAGFPSPRGHSKIL